MLLLKRESIIDERPSNIYFLQIDHKLLSVYVALLCSVFPQWDTFTNRLTWKIVIMINVKVIKIIIIKSVGPIYNS